MRRRAWLVAAVAALGCSETPVVVTPRSFERPGRVAFACFESATGAPVALDRCQVAEDGTSDAATSLFALVTQTARGEVASVDLRRNALLDADPRVPGFTFVPVGELPTDLVVPSRNPQRTYVASAGARAIWSVPTAAFRGGVLPSASDAVETPLAEGAPGALALTPDETSLLVAVPSAGAVLVYPLDAAGALGTPARVDLSGTVPSSVDALAGTDWGKLCPAGDLSRPAAAARAPVRVGDAPRPAGFAVDAAHGVAYVADAALPIVHVLDLATLAERPALAVGVPTREIALTPDVPTDELAGDCAAGDPCTQYLYAIDATDGSVLVVDVGAASVLPVSTSPVAPVDRVRLGSGARGLAVVAPDYPGGEACDVSDPLAAAATPLRIRGVAVVVTLNDGTIRVVDVLDLDAPCRGGAACVDPPIEGDQIVGIRRHRPRIAALSRSGVALVGSPVAVLDGQAYPFTTSGGTESPLAPDLAATPCPAGLSQAYPPSDDGATSLVCALGEPWSAVAERWTARWQGFIPGTQGGRGNLDEATPRLDDPGLGFCRNGVLGSLDAPASDAPEAGYGGDVLVITSAPPAGGSDATCATTFPLDATGQPAPVIVPIRAAYEDHLELEGVGSVGDTSVEWSRIASCFEELVTFEVRTRGAYTVVGARTGFLHRVVAADGDGRCTVDASQPATRVGRARPGVPFVGSLLAFTLGEGGFTDGQSLDVVFAVGNVPPKLAIDLGSLASGGRTVGSLPSAVRWSPTDRNVFVVDEASHGLVEISLDPYSATHTFE